MLLHAPALRGCQSGQSRLNARILLRVRRTGPSKRSFFTNGWHGLSETFLDVALALPYSPYLPPYTTTIILTTVLSRAAFTLPFSIWAKRRQIRLESQALPALIAFRNVKAKEVAMGMKKEGFKGNVEQFRDEHTRRLKEKLQTEQVSLFKKFRCSPFPTIIIPVLTQLPLFVASSIFFSNISMRPSPLDAESFLTLTSLARPDPTAAFPIALGLVTLANVETAQWFVDPGKLVSQRKRQGNQQSSTKPPSNKRLNVIVQSSLRVFSVFRIVIATMVDGSVVIYWLTSATFGLLQSWVFNAWEARVLSKMRNHEASSMPPK